jgi:hypothetical protein
LPIINFYEVATNNCFTIGKDFKEGILITIKVQEYVNLFFENSRSDEEITNEDLKNLRYVVKKWGKI